MAPVVSASSRWNRRMQLWGRTTCPELQDVNRNLKRANDELVAANADLRTANADLRTTNGELLRSVAELEAFAGEISHDLKGPLVAVSGYADLLAYLDLGPTRPPEYDEFLAEIVGGTQRMRWLIDEVLAYATARDAGLNVVPIELGPLVDEVLAARTGHLRHSVGRGELVPHITVAPLPAIAGDRVMIRRVIDNLVGNAIKYVSPGEAARVHITAGHAVAGWIRLEIIDQGIGIPDGQHETVFAERHRAHPGVGYPGTGLGLAICRRIVQRHGGHIGAEPQPYGGTRFWLTVPAADPNAAAVRQHPEAAHHSDHGGVLSG